MTSRSSAWPETHWYRWIGRRRSGWGQQVVAPCLLLLTGAARGAAQISGVVQGVSGMPIPAAVVEAWSGQARSGSSESDHAGRFRIAAGHDRPIETITVRAIGFRPRVLSAPFSRPLTLTLEASAVALPDIAVVTHDQCTARLVRRSAGLWATVLSRYADPSAIGPVTAEIHSFDDVMAIPDLSVRRDSLTGRGKFGVTAAGRASLEDRVRQDGYRWPGAPMRREKWDYPPLERELVTHFLGRRFTSMHDVAEAPGHAEPGGTIVVLACARQRTKPFIDAVVVLRPDSTIESIAWFVRTASGAAEAGGAVLLLPPAVPRGQLVPTASMTWRRAAAGTYRQRTYLFTGWK